MAKRELRAVGGDWHGFTVEKVPRDGKSESIAQEGREFWARCVTEAAFLLGIKLVVDPMKLWRTKCETELRAPRMEGGRPIRVRTYYETVNYLILRAILRDQKQRNISEVQLRRMAREVRHLHRRDFFVHAMRPDIREFVHWVYDIGLDYFVHTGQDDNRVQAQGLRCNVPWERISKVFTTQRLQSNKMTKQFWEQVMAELGLQSWQMVVLDNNAVQGTFCTVLGIPVLVLDRDGERKKFFTQRGPRLREAPILNDPSQIPPRAAFVAFARTPQEIRDWILAMNPVRQPRLPGVR